MRPSIQAVFFFALFSLFAPLLHGQSEDGAAQEPVNAPVGVCDHLFSAGDPATNNSMFYCVSNNGNIGQIDIPYGYSQVGSTGGEGYGLCQESPPTEYHDYLVDYSYNWKDAKVLSLSTASIKISRTTSDGNWTLVQTITKIPATASIKVVMSLTNHQAVDKVVYLVRFVDVDPAGAHIGGSYAGASLQSAWNWLVNPNPGSFHWGLQLINATKSPFTYQQGFARPVDTGPNACDFAGGSDPSGFVAGGNDGTSIAYAYAGVVGAKKTVTVTLNYRGT
jgi:hypothetical protein